jgi:hypothetical protein
MNSVKIYGANSGRYGTSRDAQERFWRNIIGGLASSRFHRPLSGLGLNPTAQSHIKSMRMFLAELDIFSCEPHNDLLENRSWNEAYCTAQPGVQYGVFFPDGGDVRLNISRCESNSLCLKWLNIKESQWHSSKYVHRSSGETWLSISTPSEDGYWAAVVSTNKE